MSFLRFRSLAFLLLLAIFAALPVGAQSIAAHESELSMLVAASLGETPLIEDLRYLSTEIGGRATGSPANLRAVEWALQRFRDAGVSARQESFEMPRLWLETRASATVSGENLEFEARAASMPFSTATPDDGISARLVDAGSGTEQDFENLGERARGSFLLVETVELLDIDGLFREYNEAYEIERRAVAAEAAGVVYMSSRAEGLLYRHNSSLRGEEERPMLVLERGAAKRAMDLLRAGRELTLTARIELEPAGAYESYNVIGEIVGSSLPEEVVLIGAHLDSWDLGNGALDNGANVALVIDIARQMKGLGIQPRRTVRFALWNGEEQGLEGSFAYTRDHESELDQHVMAMSFDIGCGLINGFFTGGRPEVAEVMQGALAPVQGLGPFTQIDVPIVGTDNYDFMMQGVANLVGNQEAASYGPNYHSQSDTFEQCDQRNLRLNSAIVAAVTLAFASDDIGWSRQTREEIEALIDSTDLEQQMRTFNVWEPWQAGTRGRSSGQPMGH